MILALLAVLALGGADDTMISRAVFADGRLWLRTDHGAVFSIAEGEKQRRDETSGNALDLCVWHKHVLALVGDAKSARLKSANADGAWKTEVPLDALCDSATLQCDDAAVRVLSGDRLVSWRDGKVSELKLSDQVGGLTVALY